MQLNIAKHQKKRDKEREARVMQDNLGAEHLVVEKFERRLSVEHPATIDPTTVPDECMAVRIARCSGCLQRHVCGDGCLLRKCKPGRCRKRGMDPTLQALAALPEPVRTRWIECKKHFPRVVPFRNTPPRAHVVMDVKRMIRYNAPRDDGYVNACQPVFAHVWGANTDFQILHGEGMRVAYVHTL